MDLLTNPVFKAYIASAVVLALNLLVLANNTAVTRGVRIEMVNPEDKVLLPAGSVVYDGGNEVTARYRRAHRNALENIPLFLVTGFLLVLVGPPPALAYALFAIFVLLRVVHSVAYIASVQPWRTLSFAVSALDQTAIVGALAWFTFVR